MLAKDIPMKDVNRILYGDKNETEESENNFQPQAKQPESEQRLLKQRGLKDFTLEKRPYYKRPIVQIGFILLIGFPITWLLLSAFNPGFLAQPEQAENSPLEKENEQLKDSLAQARQQIDDLTLDKGLEDQEIELVKPVEAEETEPEPEPPPKIAPVQQPPRPRPVAQPVVYRQPIRTTPVVSRRQVVESIEEIEPMEQWLAQAGRGYSVSSYEKTGIARPVIASNPTPYFEPRKTLGSELSGSVLGDKPQVTSPIQVAAVQVEETSTKPFKTNPTLFDDARLQPSRNRELPWNNEQFRSRLHRGKDILSKPKPPRLISSRPGATQTTKTNAVTFNSTVEVAQSLSLEPNKTASSKKLLDIGSYAEAILGDGIAWTTQSLPQDRKYLLHLDEAWKNNRGVEVLPKGTRLIAQVTKVSNSGLFFMEVTHILLDWSTPKIAVPPGTLEIVSQDGSPLKAELKQKGSDNFWPLAGAIIAPGIERAMDSVADSADSLLLNDGARSIISTNGDSNPLASGISGVAKGAANVLSNRMRSRSNQNNVVPYFQFDGEQTVRIRVNEDFWLP